MITFVFKAHMYICTKEMGQWFYMALCISLHARETHRFIRYPYTACCEEGKGLG